MSIPPKIIVNARYFFFYYFRKKKMSNFPGDSPRKGTLSPMFGSRQNLFSPQPGGASPFGSFTSANDEDNIFDRIRKMEMDNKGEEFNIEQEQGTDKLIPLSSSKFTIFGSGSSGSRIGINHAAPTPQEIVSRLNDDPYLIKALITGENFSLDDVLRYFTSLSSELFSAALTEVTEQMRRLAIVDSISSNIGQMQDVEISIPELENVLSTAFANRQVIIWYNVPTAHQLFSPTHKTRIIPGKGIVGRAAENQTRRILSRPKESEWYNAETDQELFEGATCVVCTPIADPLTHQLIAVLTITAKNSWTNFDTVLLDHAETKLPHLLATLKISASKIRSTLAVLSTATGNELKQRPLISNAAQSLTSALNCEVAQIFFVNWQKGVLEFYGSGVGKKQRIPLAQGGIAAFVAQDGNLVNIPIASQHPHFSKVIDDEYRSRPVIAVPMINESSPNHEIFGVAVARGKRGSQVFTQHDAIQLESLAAVTARTLSNFQRYRSDVLNLKRVLTAQDHYIELLTTAESLSSVINKDQLFEMIMTRSRRLVSADRCSLFTTDRNREYLLSKVASGTSRSIVLPIANGIAGHVATTGQLLNIPDAYEDPRFNKDVDLSTGYRTKSILCVPIIGRAEQVIGVTQMINKQGESQVFTPGDVDLMKAFNVFCGIALSNANLFDDTNTMKNRVEGLLNLAMSMSREKALPLILEHISESAIELINAERCTVFLMDSTAENIAVASNEKTNAQIGFIKEVIKTKTLLNIPDVTKDNRFDPSEDQRTSFTSKSFLIAPIIDEEKNVLGIIQLVNKVPGYDGLVFTKDDERLMSAMTSFAGYSISKVMNKSSKQLADTVFDLYSTGAEQLGLVMQQMRLTNEEENMLSDPKAYMRGLPLNVRLRLMIFPFTSYNLLENLNIPFITFFQFLMLFQTIGKDLPYHNTDQSLDCLQCVYVITKLTAINKTLEPVELFALLMAALLHNANHQGEQGGLLSRTRLPLEILFKNQPAAETYQADSAIRLLANKSVTVLDSLSDDLRAKFWNIFTQLILSSGVYKQADFIQLWRSGDHSKLNQMRLVLKIANLSSVTRPYDIAMKHGQLRHQELQQVMQEEKLVFGASPDKDIQDLIDATVEASELKLAQDLVLPLLDIGVSKWKPLDVFKNQLLDNIKKWKDVVATQEKHQN